MLSELCAEIRNYFLDDPKRDIHRGRFAIVDGSIEPLSFLQEGQYFRIKGSVFNNGIWVYGNACFEKDEVFTGEIWAMSVPASVISLSNEIDDWIQKNADVLNSPYQSESFGGYSYSKGSSYANNNGNSVYSWRDQFAPQLSRYRRISLL